MPSDSHVMNRAPAAQFGDLCDHLLVGDPVREAVLMVGSAKKSGWIVPLLVFGSCASLAVLLWMERGGAGQLALELLLSAVLGLAIFLLYQSASRIREAEFNLSETQVDADEALENRSVFNLVTEGLLVVREDGRILMTNGAVRSMHGCTGDSFEPASLGDLFMDWHDDLLRVILAQIELQGRAHVECLGLRRDQTRFEAVLRGVRSSHQGQPALLLSVKDLTERRAAAEDRTVLARKVLVAQEEERTRISRDLHDGLGQVIAALHFEVDWMSHRMTGGPDASDEATRLIDEAGNELRRICRGLRPPLLDDLGLMPSVRQLVEEFEVHWPLTIDLEIRLDEDRYPLPSDVALAAFRILQETLTNVVRHAKAQKVNITLVREYQWLVLSVYDNGQGFQLSELAHATGFGIEGMRERARLVNGTIELVSVPDQGTRVVMRVPVPRLPGEEPS